MQTLEEIHGRDVLIMAGSGGNGGGGICCARHLVNHGYKVSLVTTRETEELRGAAKSQWTILQKSGFKILAPSEIQNKIEQAALVIDALIGYSLHGPPRGFTSELIGLCNQHAKHIISLDMPSGMDASNGNTPGIYIKPRKTITLALPKAGLKNPEAGELVLADIGIPAAVYRHIGIHIETIFGKNYQVPIYRSKNF
jgi:NAD(P)H-hydrate epimerase